MLVNASFMFISTLARLLSGFALFIVLARIWGAHTFGTFMFPYVLSTFAVISIDYGFGLQLVKDIAKSREKTANIVAEAFGAKILLSVLVIFISFVIISIYQANLSFQFLFWPLLIAAILNSFGLFLGFPLRAHDRFRAETWTALIANFALAALAGTLAIVGVGPFGVAIAFVVARLIFVIVAGFTYKRELGMIQWKSIRFSSMLKILKTGFPFGVHLALGTLYLQVDTLIIQRFLGEHSLGLYQAGMRLLLGGMILAEVLNNVYLPLMSRIADKASEFADLGKNLTQNLLFVGSLGCIILSSGAPWIVAFIYGDEYSELNRLLPLFAIILLLRYGGACWGLMLTVSDKQILRMTAVFLAFLINILLNLIFIPNYGLVGAVTASIITHIILNAIYMMFSRDPVKGFGLSSRSLGLILASICHISLTLYWFEKLELTSYWVISGILILIVGILGIEPRHISSLRRRLQIPIKPNKISHAVKNKQ